MSYLYGEISAGERAGLTAHLQSCPDCKAAVNDWQMARKKLDAWHVRSCRAESPARRAFNVFAVPAFKWAAAAAVMLAVGFGAGRLTPATTDMKRVRAAIEPEIRRQLQQEVAELVRAELNKSAADTLAASGEQTEELAADYAAALEAKRTEDNQAIYAALQKLDSQRIADYLSLKRDLDTVALNTDAGLRRTEQQMVQLADYTQPASTPNPPRN